MKFNALVSSSGMKETFKHVSLKNTNLNNWKKEIYNKFRKQASEIIFDESEKNK